MQLIGWLEWRYTAQKQRDGWPAGRRIAAHSAGPTAQRHSTRAGRSPNTFAHDASTRGPVVEAGSKRGESGVVDFAGRLRLIS